MNPNEVCMDDIQDVAQMSAKIEFLIGETLKEQDIDIAISSLMSAFINILLSQSHTLEEFLYFREVFNILCDSSIDSNNNKFKRIR